MGASRTDIFCADTIHRILNLIGPCPLDRDVAVSVARDAGEISQQVIRASAAGAAVIGRKLEHFVAVKAGRNRLRLRIDEFRIGHDRDLLRRSSHHKFHIGAHDLTRGDHNVLRGHFAEARRSHGNRIQTRLQVFRLVISLGVTVYLARNVFALVGDRNHHVGHHRTRGVGNRAENCSEGRLPQSGRRKTHNTQC